MTTGRSVWFVNGNITSEQAINIVDQANTTLGLQTVKIENLPDVRGVSFESQTSFQFEEALVDDKNENSCTTIWFEVGAH